MLYLNPQGKKLVLAKQPLGGGDLPWHAFVYNSITYYATIVNKEFNFPETGDLVTNNWHFDLYWPKSLREQYHECWEAFNHKSPHKDYEAEPNNPAANLTPEALTTWATKYIKVTQTKEKTMYVIMPDPNQFQTKVDDILFTSDAFYADEKAKTLSKHFKEVSIFKLESVYKVPKMPKAVKYTFNDKGEMVPA